MAYCSLKMNQLRNLIIQACRAAICNTSPAIPLFSQHFLLSHNYNLLHLLLFLTVILAMPLIYYLSYAQQKKATLCYSINIQNEMLLIFKQNHSLQTKLFQKLNFMIHLKHHHKHAPVNVQASVTFLCDQNQKSGFHLNPYYYLQKRNKLNKSCIM